MAIGFVGLSHLGVVSSICWASQGWPVVGVDDDEAVVSSLAEGRLATQEPGLVELFASNRSGLTFTTDFSLLADCDVVFISLDTETDRANRIVLSRLEQLIAQAVPWLTPGAVVVLMSQVPVGYTRQLGQRIRDVCYWAETLVVGDAVERCLNPERVILGCEGDVPACLEAILSKFSCPVLKMSYESAELTKAAINLYLSVSVTFANVLADLCEATGASMREIAPALRSDRRIGQHAYIRPGLGIAGGHLERDLVHLSQLDADIGLIDYILDYNAKRYRWAHRQLARHVFSEKARPRIALWGLAYKKNTQSTKNSFAVRILHDLLGKADLCVYDPAALLPGELQAGVVSCGRYEAAHGADCLLVLADWDEFVDTDFAVLASEMRGRVLMDCAGVLDRGAATRQGFRFVSVGEPCDT
jgi:UDPglucose 6-dehydrogenase